MGVAKSKALFLEKFPEFREQWERNRVRTAGFIKYTTLANTKKGYGVSVDTSALPSLKRINALGFFTLDSQTGEFIKDNYRERAYCEGFIPNQLLSSFVKYLNECNEKLEIVVYPNNDINIPLTLQTVNGVEKTFTVIPRYTESEIQPYAIDAVLNAGERGSTESYYEGPPVGHIDIDPSRWTLVLVFDPAWGHNAVDETGVFMCIEDAMTRALQEPVPQNAGRRRRRLMTRRYCKKTPCRRMGFTQKASCRPYKNCYQ